MDEQNRHAETPREPVGEEIARAAAGPSDPPQAADTPAADAPDFVPYVDDAPRPEPDTSGGDGDSDEPYVPGPWERRIDAMPEKQWRLCLIAGGSLVGLAAVASLFVFGEDLSMYGLVVAALLALVLPRYLERAWRRKLTTARYAMAVAMLVGLVIIGVITGIRTGFVFTKTQ